MRSAALFGTIGRMDCLIYVRDTRAYKMNSILQYLPIRDLCTHSIQCIVYTQHHIYHIYVLLTIQNRHKQTNICLMPHCSHMHEIAMEIGSVVYTTILSDFIDLLVHRQVLRQLFTRHACSTFFIDYSPFNFFTCLSQL